MQAGCTYAWPMCTQLVSEHRVATSCRQLLLTTSVAERLAHLGFFVFVVNMILSVCFVPLWAAVKPADLHGRRLRIVAAIKAKRFSSDPRQAIPSVTYVWMN